MVSIDKLGRTIEQLNNYETSGTITATKKKETKVHLLNLIEYISNPNLHAHKDFVAHIGPSIGNIIKLCDSTDYDLRSASEEGLGKVIKALVPLHSNRILVELCKQIKKNESPRVLKLSLNRFADLCHHAR